MYFLCACVGMIAQLLSGQIGLPPTVTKFEALSVRGSELNSGDID